MEIYPYRILIRPQNVLDPVPRTPGRDGAPNTDAGRTGVGTAPRAKADGHTGFRPHFISFVSTLSCISSRGGASVSPL